MKNLETSTNQWLIDDCQDNQPNQHHYKKINLGGVPMGKNKPC